MCVGFDEGQDIIWIHINTQKDAKHRHNDYSKYLNYAKKIFTTFFFPSDFGIEKPFLWNIDKLFY